MKVLILLSYVDDFYQPFPAVEEFLFLGSKFNLAVHYGINSIIVSEADAITGKKFRTSLANYNIARLSDLTVMKFYAKIFGLRISS